MQFTPQQMAGYKGYSPGVLIGNWSEDLQVMEDKMKLYMTIKSGTLSNANNTFALTAVMTEPAPIGPSAEGGYLPFGIPLMIQSEATEGILALDITPKYAPRLNHVKVSFAAKTAAKQARSVWVLHRVADDNSDFYQQVQEEGIVHYGQKLRIVNESAGSHGFYSLVTSLQDTSRSSGRQEVAACLGGGNTTIFTVEPAGALPGSMDGRPVLSTDKVVLLHKGSHAPVACEACDRCATSFGSELEAGCGIVKSQQTRAQSRVCSQDGNFFRFVMLPPNTPWKPAPAKFVPQALERVRSKILERGGRLGFRGLVRSLRVMDSNGDRCLSRAEFRDAMEVYGVHLTSADLDSVFKTFDRNGDGTVTITEFIRTLRGDMNERRIAVVHQAFDRLNRDGRGDVELQELIDVYRTNAPKHPDAGQLSHEDLVKEFVSCWGGKDGRISRAQFVEYYNDISAGTDRDDYFELLVRNAWHISGGTGVSENTTARRILVVLQDDSQHVVELKDDLGLRADDSAGILKKLADQGLTQVKRYELYA